MSIHSWICWFNQLTVKSIFILNQADKMIFHLRMTILTWYCSKAEKNFLNFKLKGIASTVLKIKLQICNSFHIATIYSTYLNNDRIAAEFARWSNRVIKFTWLKWFLPPISQNWPFNVPPHEPYASVPLSKFNFRFFSVFPGNILN